MVTGALMSTAHVEQADFDQVIEQLVENDYAIVDNSLPAGLLSSLEQHFSAIEDASFKRAGVGRASDFQNNKTIRNDLIHWLESDQSEVINRYFQCMEALRLQVNRAFFLGLFDYECHYARYAKGSFYKRHLDVFRGQENRRLTTILYLNHNWSVSDGGMLRMYRDNEQEPFAEVIPEYGRMVVFFSELFPHEVCPANRTRHSLTGWFRVNDSDSRSVNPIG